MKNNVPVIIILLFVSTSFIGVMHSTGRLMFDDNTPPVTTHSLDGVLGNNGIFMSEVEVTLDATDDLSGVNTTFYHNAGEPTLEYDHPFVISEQGTQAFGYYSIDNAGNTEEQHFVQVLIDLYPPYIWLSGGWDIKQGLWWVYASVSDDCSNIDRVEFYIDDELVHVIPKYGPYLWTYEYPGCHSIFAKVYDEAGHNATDEHPQESSFSKILIPNFFNHFWWLNSLLDRFPLVQRLLERLN